MSKTRARPPVGTTTRRGGNRWTRWARTFRRRGSRVLERWRGLVLTLARCRAALHVHVGRVLRTGMTTIHPRFDVNVSLSFAPLGAQRRREIPPQSRVSAPPRVAGTAVIDQRDTFVAARLPALSMIRPRRLPTFHARTVHPPTTKPVLALARPSPASEIVAARDAARTHDSPAAPSLAIIRRVVQERRRVEQRAPLPLVTQRPAASAMRANGADATIMQSPRGARVGGPGMAQPPPAIDIERLIDQVVRQINHGIIAQRERMGRLS